MKKELSEREYFSKCLSLIETAQKIEDLEEADDLLSELVQFDILKASQVYKLERLLRDKEIFLFDQENDQNRILN